jgi:hypothetical protein
MKFVELRPFGDPDFTARKLVEIANGIEAVQDGRFYIEASTRRFWRPTSAPGSRAGFGGTRAAPM